MEANAMMLGAFIREQRNQRNMTQEYLASELGMSRPTYTHVEHDRRELTVSEAQKLVGIFDLSLEDFLAGRAAPKHTVKPAKQAAKKAAEELHIRVTEKHPDKFKEVLLYILNRVGGKPNVGETVLHKLLYFIDFDYYEKFEETLMGATYIRNHHGPTSVELNKVLRDMQKNGEIEAVESQYFKYPQRKYLPHTPPDLDKLSAREINHVDDVLARLSDKNAKEIEDYSHGDIPWRAAQHGEPLSYESVFYRDDKYSVRTYDDEL